jgi:hypothetical protein
MKEPCKTIIEELQAALSVIQPQLDAIYGYCPKCGAKGVTRERRPNGYDTCANGHTYPSASATQHVVTDNSKAAALLQVRVRELEEAADKLREAGECTMAKLDAIILKCPKRHLGGGTGGGNPNYVLSYVPESVLEEAIQNTQQAIAAYDAVRGTK